jgi:glycosyltransferase involved in cell wall biosynthesis
MDKPLISFVIVSYNQETLVREAVESALAQTYSPLEIIISDDASKDRTFEVIRQTVADYKGPHTIRLNRNETNLGMGRHLNRVMELCSGELVIGQAGDDVSVPERAEVTYQAWDKSGRRATSVFSSYTTIFLDGEVYDVGGLRGERNDSRLCWPLEGTLFKFLSTSKPVVNGCAHAFSPQLFRYFGPLKSDLEDLVLSFRTLAIGEMLYVHQPLVKYRRHENNVSFFAGGDDTRSFEHRERRLLWVNKQTVAAYDTMLGDIEKLGIEGRITVAERDRLLVEARRVRCYYAVELQMMESPNIFSRVWVILRAALQGQFRCALRCSVRILPHKLYKGLYLLRNKWRSFGVKRPSATTPIRIP